MIDTRKLDNTCLCRHLVHRNLENWVEKFNSVDDRNFEKESWAYIDRKLYNKQIVNVFNRIEMKVNKIIKNKEESSLCNSVKILVMKAQKHLS